jgi:hypothetical protein
LPFVSGTKKKQNTLANIQHVPKNRYVPIVLDANMTGLSLPITALSSQLTAVVSEVLFALVLFVLRRNNLI